MRLSRLIPTTNALPARHARSASPDMVALLRVPDALVCRPRGRGPSLLPLPVHAAILLGFKRLPRMQVRPTHVPAPPSTPADRVLIALCVSLSEAAVCLRRRPRHRFLLRYCLFGTTLGAATVATSTVAATSFAATSLATVASASNRRRLRLARHPPPRSLDRTLPQAWVRRLSRTAPWAAVWTAF
jgi:hypothetical protein